MRRLLTLLALLLPLTAGAQLTNTIPWTYSVHGSNHVIVLSGSTYASVGVVNQTNAVIISASGQAVRVYDYRGALALSGTSPLTNAFAPGHYFIETNGDRFGLLVWPTNAPARCDLVGVHSSGIWAVTDFLNAAVRPEWDRLTQSSWAGDMSTTNTFNWSTRDAAYAVATNRGGKVIFYMGAEAKPAWVATGDMTQFSNYCVNVMNRYHPWGLEVVNEPADGTATNVANLVKMAAIARDAVMPTCKIVGPSYNSSVWPKSQSLILDALGASAKVDVWSVHDYDFGRGQPVDAATNQFSQSVLTFGTTNMAKPWLVTELGLYGASSLGYTTDSDPVYSSSGASWYTGTLRSIKYLVLAKAHGCIGIVPQIMTQFVNWSATNSNHEVFGFEIGPPSPEPNYGRGPHAKTSAFLLTAARLNGLTITSVVESGVLRAYTFSDGSTWAWATEGNTTSFPANGRQVTDVYGNTVTNYGGQLGEQLLRFCVGQPDPGSGRALNCPPCPPTVTNTVIRTVTLPAPPAIVLTNTVTRTLTNSVPMPAPSVDDIVNWAGLSRNRAGVFRQKLITKGVCR